jgi:hypothetical protein
MRRAGYVGGIGEMKNSFNILVGKSLEDIWVSSWKDTINIGLKETECEYMDWIHLAQDRAQWRRPSGSMNNGELHCQLTNNQLLKNSDAGI